ncbi:MAG: FAD-dependent oxidoreductase, partial [Candidatus Latescibacteria bacterium]|nr:FAD-dependent oxidoreductase [Candidatus Latescibacterota bacterium]
SIPDDALVCYTPFAGFLDAARCVDTHVAMAVNGGAEVLQECKVLNIDLSGEYPEVHTSEGKFRARRLIVAGGPWSGDLMGDLAIPLKVTRQQKCYFTCDRSKDHLPASLPVYADYETDYYGFPWYGSGVKVADDIHGPTIHPDQVDRAPDKGLAANLQNWLQKLMPYRKFTYHSTDTCMYTVTPDRDFILGRHPEHAGVILGAGFSGHGFKFTTLIGRWLADLALRDETNYDMSRFSPDRFTV